MLSRSALVNVNDVFDVRSRKLFNCTRVAEIAPNSATRNNSVVCEMERLRRNHRCSVLQTVQTMALFGIGSRHAMQFFVTPCTVLHLAQSDARSGMSSWQATQRVFVGAGRTSSGIVAVISGL